MKSRYIVLLLGLFMGVTSWAQPISVKIYPHTTRSIYGQSDLDTKRYFNLCSSPANFDSYVQSEGDQTNYLSYYNLSFGRGIGVISGEVAYRGTIKEDVSRSGYVDLAWLRNKANPAITEGYKPPIPLLKEKFPLSAGYVATEKENAFPDFFPKREVSGTHFKFPSNIEAAAEATANVLKYCATDWARAQWYEPINEPDYRWLWTDVNCRFMADYHLGMQTKIKELNPSLKTGGPCISTCWFYGNNYSGFDNMKRFIDMTDGKLDFYSFHIYDNMGWDPTTRKLYGRISTGLPMEGVLDLISNYGRSKFGKELQFITSEHGGYINDARKKQEFILHCLGPSDGTFAYDMKAKSIADYFMVHSAITNTFTFMERPHQVQKAIPFIIMESSGWDMKYHASLLVRENWIPNGPFYETTMINFYRFFGGVTGRRVLTRCDSPDIQQTAFVNGKVLNILLNNLSDKTVALALDYPQENISRVLIRRLKRDADYQSKFSQSSSGDKINIEMSEQESVVLIVTYKNDIIEDKTVNEETHFANEYLQQFSTSKVFNLNLTSNDNLEYAYLRIGVGRSIGTDRDMDVQLNGVTLLVPMELSADILEDTYLNSSYASSKVIQVDKSLLRVGNNVIQVSFKDGKAGGIASVALVTGKMETPNLIALPRKNENYLYPTVTTDNLHFKTPIEGRLTIQTLSGVEMARINSSNLSTFSVSSLYAGSYVVTVQSENNIETFRFVKK